MHANFIVKTGNYFGGSDVSNFIKKRSKFVDEYN